LSSPIAFAAPLFGSPFSSLAFSVGRSPGPGSVVKSHKVVLLQGAQMGAGGWAPVAPSL